MLSANLYKSGVKSPRSSVLWEFLVKHNAFATSGKDFPDVESYPTTHYLLDGGVFRVPRPHHMAFLTAVGTDCEMGERWFIVEKNALFKNVDTLISPFFEVDVTDHTSRWAGANEAQFIDKFVRFVADVISPYLSPVNMIDTPVTSAIPPGSCVRAVGWQVVVLESFGVAPATAKFGFHVHFINILVTIAHMQQLRNIVITALKCLPCFEDGFDWGAIIDPASYRPTAGIRLPGQFKAAKSKTGFEPMWRAYYPTKLYTFTAKPHTGGVGTTDVVSLQCTPPSRDAPPSNMTRWVPLLSVSGVHLVDMPNWSSQRSIIAPYDGKYGSLFGYLGAKKELSDATKPPSLNRKLVQLIGGTKKSHTGAIEIPVGPGFAKWFQDAMTLACKETDATLATKLPLLVPSKLFANFFDHESRLWVLVLVRKCPESNYCPLKKAHHEHSDVAWGFSIYFHDSHQYTVPASDFRRVIKGQMSVKAHCFATGCTRLAKKAIGISDKGLITALIDSLSGDPETAHTPPLFSKLHCAAFAKKINNVSLGVSDLADADPDSSLNILIGLNDGNPLNVISAERLINLTTNDDCFF